MTVTEFKRIINALSTYATVREKATGPETLIGVQSKDGILKLVAANGRGGIAVTAGVGEFPTASFTVLGRPLLNAAKVLKGKIDLQWVVGPDNLQLVSDKGGSIVCDASGSIKESGFARKPQRVLATGFVNGAGYGQIARIFDAVQRDIESNCPTIHFYEDKAVLTAISPVNKELYATLSIPSTGVTEEVYGSAYMEFWKALKVLDQEGTIEFGTDGVIARSGVYEVFSSPWRISPYDRKTRTSLPVQNPKPHIEFIWRDNDSVARVTIDRKILIDAIKGQAPDEELARVTLQVDTGSLQVYAYGAEAGLTLPAVTENSGIRSVQGPLMLDMLRAFDSKDVELSWGSPSPGIRLNNKEYNGWTVLIAPVTM
jgi:hypothetical protein